MAKKCFSTNSQVIFLACSSLDLFNTNLNRSKPKCMIMLIRTGCKEKTLSFSHNFVGKWQALELFVLWALCFALSKQIRKCLMKKISLSVSENLNIVKMVLHHRALLIYWCGFPVVVKVMCSGIYDHSLGAGMFNYDYNLYCLQCPWI